LGTSTRERPGTAIRCQRDPGQAGEYQNQHLRSLLTGYDAKGLTLNLSKLDRAGPLSRARKKAFSQVLNRSHSGRSKPRRSLDGE
jgi:hypothetical protein